MPLKHKVLKESMKWKLLTEKKKKDIKKNIWTYEGQRWHMVNCNKSELNDLFRNKNIINYIKAQRLTWFAHVRWVTNDRMVKKRYEFKLLSTRLVGRPKIRWENDTKEDLRIMNICNWTKYIQDWVKWKEAAEKAKTFEQLSCSIWWS